MSSIRLCRDDDCGFYVRLPAGVRAMLKMNNPCPNCGSEARAMECEDCKKEICTDCGCQTVAGDLCRRCARGYYEGDNVLDAQALSGLAFHACQKITPSSPPWIRPPRLRQVRADWTISAINCIGSGILCVHRWFIFSHLPHLKLKLKKVALPEPGKHLPVFYLAARLRSLLATLPTHSKLRGLTA